MEVNEILIIKNSQETYGILTEDINQISRVPMLMPLPLRPKGVRGLCSVAGNIVSMLDMNLLLGLPPVDYDAHKTRILSLNNQYASNALLVSEVYNTVEVEEDRIEYIDTKNDPVIAIYKYHDLLVQVLSLEVLINQVNKVTIESSAINQGKMKAEANREEEFIRFLIFHMGREKFALDIVYLQEIILADVKFTEVMGSPDEVLGLITLRDELLLIVDLRSYYGFDSKKDDKNRILIASYGSKRIGLLIDSIIDIRNFTTKNVEYMDHDHHEVKISGVIHDDKSLISFLDHKILADILLRNESFVESVDEIEEETKKAQMEVIVFKLLDKEYAFDVDNVDEIIDYVESTHIAYSDADVDGIINIRGQIVTIVSLFKKLQIQTKIHEDSKIIICNIDGNRLGFVVDSVSDILNIYEKDMKTSEDDFFTNVIYLDGGKRLILSMDIHKIVNQKGEISA